MEENYQMKNERNYLNRTWENMFCAAERIENGIVITNDLINITVLDNGLPVRYFGKSCPVESTIIIQLFGMFSRAKYIILFWNDIQGDDSLSISDRISDCAFNKIFYKIYNKDGSCSSNKVNFMLKFSNAVIIVGDNKGYMLNRTKENAGIYNVE